MYTNHVNPVALETQDRFCTVLFELIAQKPLEKITVTELCRAAGFERMTFYRHFDEKNDIITYYLDRQMMLLMGSLPAHSTLLNNLKALFQWVYSERANLCLLMDCRMTSLLSDALGRNIFSMLSTNLSRREWEQFPASPYADDDPFMHCAVMGIFCGLLTAWRSDGFKETPLNVAHRMLLLMGIHPGLLRHAEG